MLNRYLSFNKNPQVDFIIKLAIATALLLLVGPVVLDIKGTVPITLQSLVVLIGAIAFGWRIGVIAVLIYIFAGALGLPVFAGYKGGADALMGPYGGFFFGFVAAAVITGFISEKEGFHKPIPAMMVWFLGHAVIILFGMIWIYRFDPLGWKEKLQAIVPGAVIKSVAGALILQLIVRFFTRDRKRAFEE